MPKQATLFGVPEDPKKKSKKTTKKRSKKTKKKISQSDKNGHIEEKTKKITKKKTRKKTKKTKKSSKKSSKRRIRVVKENKLADNEIVKEERQEIDYDNCKEDCNEWSDEFAGCLHSKIAFGWKIQPYDEEQGYEFRINCIDCKYYNVIAGEKVTKEEGLKLNKNAEALGYCHFTPEYYAIAFGKLRCPKPNCNELLEMRISKDKWCYFCNTHKQLLTREHRQILVKYGK